MDPNSGSDHDEEDDKSLRGPTLMKKKTNHKGKPVVTYNNQGVPIGEVATKLSTFEGVIARSMIPISYATWNDVSADTKEEIWQYVLANYVVDPKSRKHTLQSIGSKWRNFKHALYKDYIEVQKDDPELRKNLLNPPQTRPSVGKSDRKVFVSQRTSKTWEEKSKKAKEVRAKNKYNHHLSRKGYAKLKAELMEESGKTEEEIDRAVLWKKARERKSVGFDEDVQVVVDKIDKLSEGSGEITHDVLTEALGTKEQRGHVRGMGRFVMPRQYFFLPKTVKHYMENEKKKYDQRFNKLEEELDKLKRGANNVSEAASCQMWGNEDFKDDSFEEPIDGAGFLAIDVPSNIVAKGNIMKDAYEEELVEVIVDIAFVTTGKNRALQQEAEVPIPLEEEFVVTVKDVVGHVLSWPSHLVIRCCDLEKAVAKQKRKHAEKNKKQIEKEKKRPREDAEENKKEDEREVAGEYKKENENVLEAIDEYKIDNEKEYGEKRESKIPIKGKMQVVENIGKRRTTRAQRN